MLKELIIVRGLPGSGKTTFAKQVAANNDYHHYEADDFFMTPEGQYVYEASRIKDAHFWCQKKVEETMAKSEPVIVSNTFVKNWEMEPYFVLAEKYKYRITIYETKGDYGSIHSVPTEAIERMRKNWESVNLNNPVLFQTLKDVRSI